MFLTSVFFLSFVLVLHFSELFLEEVLASLPFN